MSRALKISPLLIAALAFIVLVGYLYLPKDEVQNKQQAGVTPVTTHRIAEEEFAVIIEALGTAKANESVFLTAQTTDTVCSLFRKLGIMDKFKLQSPELNSGSEPKSITRGRGSPSPQHPLSGEGQEVE